VRGGGEAHRRLPKFTARHGKYRGSAIIMLPRALSFCWRQGPPALSYCNPPSTPAPPIFSVRLCSLPICVCLGGESVSASGRGEPSAPLLGSLSLRVGAGSRRPPSFHNNFYFPKPPFYRETAFSPYTTDSHPLTDLIND
jgi:hypothetical protein